MWRPDSCTLAGIRQKILGISPSEASFDNRHFLPGRLEARLHLENIGRTFITGYHVALAADDTYTLNGLLESVDLEMRGFAFEGAAMALTLLDYLIPWRRNRFQEFLSGPGGPHA